MRTILSIFSVFLLIISLLPAPASAGTATQAYDGHQIYALDTAGSAIYAVGAGAAVVKSTDGGQTWTEHDTGLPYSNTWLSDVVAVSESTVYVCGGARDNYIDYGFVLRSADGGGTWETLCENTHRDTDTGIPSGVRINGLCVRGDSIYAAQHNGLQKSDDGGDTWSFQYITALEAKDVLFIDDSTGFVTATANRADLWSEEDIGNFYKTTDGGATWSGVEITTSHLSELKYGSGTLAVIESNEANVWLSNDLSTFEQYSLGSGDTRQGMYIDSGSLFATGKTGVYYAPDITSPSFTFFEYGELYSYYAHDVIVYDSEKVFVGDNSGVSYRLLSDFITTSSSTSTISSSSTTSTISGATTTSTTTAGSGGAETTSSTTTVSGETTSTTTGPQTTTTTAAVTSSTTTSAQPQTTTTIGGDTSTTTVLDDLSCTDSDNDTYYAEGGDCGQVDCDDHDPDINPSMEEVCDDGKDNNCNGEFDENCGVDCRIGFLFPQEINIRDGGAIFFINLEGDGCSRGMSIGRSLSRTVRFAGPDGDEDMTEIASFAVGNILIGLLSIETDAPAGVYYVYIESRNDTVSGAAIRLKQ